MRKEGEKLKEYYFLEIKIRKWSTLSNDAERLRWELVTSLWIVQDGITNAIDKTISEVERKANWDGLKREGEFRNEDSKSTDDKCLLNIYLLCVRSLRYVSQQKYKIQFFMVVIF